MTFNFYLLSQKSSILGIRIGFKYVSALILQMVITLTLTRENNWKEEGDKKKSIKGTLTYLVKGTSKTVATLELPWKNNKKDVSCIDSGYYTNVKQFSSTGKLGKRLEIPNVPGRTGILFHVGNYPKDTEGCILVGEYSDEPDYIKNSRKTIDAMYDDFEDETGNLTIS